MRNNLEILNCMCPALMKRIITNVVFLDLSSGVFLPQPEMACQVLCKNRKQNTSQCCDPTAHCSCGTHTGHYACICPQGHYGQGLHGECTRKYLHSGILRLGTNNF